MMQIPTLRRAWRYDIDAMLFCVDDSTEETFSRQQLPLETVLGIQDPHVQHRTASHLILVITQVSSDSTVGHIERNEFANGLTIRCDKFPQFLFWTVEIKF